MGYLVGVVVGGVDYVFVGDGVLFGYDVLVVVWVLVDFEDLVVVRGGGILVVGFGEYGVGGV